MALSPLATAADLTARGITVPSGVDVDALLDEASQRVRDAAGSPILQSQISVKLVGTSEQRLVLPTVPVVSVDAITIDGDVVTDYQFVAGELFRFYGWQRNWALGWRAPLPSEVVVTYTTGFQVVPADIVGLVCSMVAAAATAAGDQALGLDPRITATAIDDYREQRSTGEDAASTVMDLPDRTARWLRDKFSAGTTTMVSVR